MTMAGISAGGIDALGVIGGTVVGLCLVPQLIKMVRSQSAQDISYGWTSMYLIGTTLLLVYLIFMGAIAAYIPLVVEIGLLLIVMVLKWHLDRKKLRSGATAVVSSGCDSDTIASTEGGDLCRECRKRMVAQHSVTIGSPIRGRQYVALEPVGQDDSPAGERRTGPATGLPVSFSALSPVK
ncbi:hypothetical protein QJQ45_016476 [Haematococcus lacustris]|nr:hypothetical protein QJQ45_016476 [Haematococcus lacustris]